MARKSIKVSESLTVKTQEEEKKLYTVDKPFNGVYNSLTLCCKPGDTILLTNEQYETYKRFLLG
jgi:aspartate/methionine/tyrosine aminotransferase